MKFKKVGLSLMLAGVMILSTVGSSQVFAISSPLSYAGSMEKMQQLKVIDKATKGEDGLVTRGQLAKAIAIADGLSSTSSNLNGTTIFPDIKANSDISGYVNGVVGVGLMFGTPDGLFHPEQYVTMAEMDTIMVRLLGYTDTDPDLSKLSWPNNYIQQAYKLGLTTDITAKKSDKLTYKVAAVLFDRLFSTLIKGSQTEYFSDKYFEDEYLNTEITGSLKEVTVVGNSKTSDDLLDNQVYLAGQGLTSLTKYTVNSNAGEIELGVKYKLYIDGSTITKVSVKENSTENYAVTSVTSSLIAYKDDNDVAHTMSLPKASLYYYHGAYVDYEVAVKAVRAYSSIILTNKSDKSGYDYGIIVDANFGKPQVYKNDNAALLDQLRNTKYSYIYRGANIQESQLNAYDVVYFVSDIWNKNTFIYVNDKVVIGTITEFTGDMLNPTGLTINNTNYTFGKYFNRARLNNYDGDIGNFLTNVNVKDFKTLILGVDGKIVDIY
ncbi:S-layer homology domain-containing protein [Clostridium bowmanii]|uniref:S-layer homology domain-containing protein n=1 Tax=Clostridium bowmanii TaxID=132925 RepID=UPI001C0CDE7D|nr:S-layer homology domain-containing protein [Clostridium bowmanii]MBU3190632.1 S-layer homology domain-containing protein [Clostridium bowmanii]MCA1072528.1 S-layer homology domain-containing protein [Clostridium bowmanii]